MAKLAKLTEENLVRLYVEGKKSLEDIAELYGVSRVAIFKKLKKFHIKPRSKSSARLEAQKQGKVLQQYFPINEKFFSRWSREMAYVLGLIITDGCISKEGRISLSMNDREVLEKVKIAMGSGHPIVPSKQQEGLYHFNFARTKLVKDLAVFGIGPKKSLVVKFPQIPDTFMGDFVRGVFDGDGSVFFRKDNVHLQKLGLPKRNIYEQKTKNGFFYSFKFSHKNSQKLFNILYKDYPNIPFMERKYHKFIDGLKRSAEYAERA